MKTHKYISGFSKIAFLIGVLFSGAVIGGVLVGLWVFQNVDARLILSEQPATVRIFDPIKLDAEVLNNLDISLNETITTQVPISKTVSIPVDETLQLDAAIKTKVPVNIDVKVNDTIPIDQVLDVDAVVTARVLGEVIDIPIRGKVPVKANVPLSLVIPVKQSIPVEIRAPVKAKLKQKLNVPLDTVIDASIPIRSDMSVPVRSTLDAMATLPSTPLPIVIEYADLKLPLRTLRLETTDEPAPERR